VPVAAAAAVVLRQRGRWRRWLGCADTSCCSAKRRAQSHRITTATPTPTTTAIAQAVAKLAPSEEAAPQQA
jgi:hypothetical protein